jgi:hypothetical protein
MKWFRHIACCINGVNRVKIIMHLVRTGEVIPS